MIKLFKVADRSGAMTLSLWDDLGLHVTGGDIIYLQKAQAAVFRSCLQLNLMKGGCVFKRGEFCMVFAEIPFLSSPNPELENLAPTVSSDSQPAQNFNSQAAINNNNNLPYLPSAIKGNSNPQNQPFPLHPNHLTPSGINFQGSIGVNPNPMENSIHQHGAFPATSAASSSMGGFAANPSGANTPESFQANYGHHYSANNKQHQNMANNNVYFNNQSDQKQHRPFNPHHQGSRFSSGPQKWKQNPNHSSNVAFNGGARHPVFRHRNNNNSGGPMKNHNMPRNQSKHNQKPY